jgi:glucokinase
MVEPLAPPRVVVVSNEPPGPDPRESPVVLAGDIGGTNARLGLFQGAPRRPRRLIARDYAIRQFGGLTDILEAFLREAQRPGAVRAAVLGVAGPVIGNNATLTNVGWKLNTAEVAAGSGAARARLVNDLEALAIGTTVLDPHEQVALQSGVVRAEGGVAVIAAGTGLGEAYLHRVNGRHRPVPSEGGHADFAARTDREWDLVRMLRQLYGRAEVEHVLSGPGLLNLHRFTHGTEQCHASTAASHSATPADVSRAALDGSCARCADALTMFVEAYGAEAGNLALRGVATSGVYVGGGIALNILPALQDGRFVAAFRAKGAMAPLAADIPISVVLSPETGLLGAAVLAQELVE